MRFDMNDPTLFTEIVSGRAIEVLTTVQIRIFRGPGADIVHLDLCDRMSKPAGTEFQMFRIVDLLRVGDITETIGQEIQSTSVDLGEFSFEIAPGHPVSLRDCASRRILDGAQIMVDRWIATPGWGREYDLRDFDGYIDQALPTDFGAALSCKAWTGKIAAASYPKHIVSPWCRHELGDASCGVVPPSETVSAGSGSTRTKFLVSGANLSVYSGGTLQMSSGVNSGFLRTVERVDDLGGGAFALHIAPPGFPWAPTESDQATLRRGCDKTLQACESFRNVTRYGGMPYVPAAESI